MILELEETKQWLRIDGEDDDSTIDLLMKAAEQYLFNATGRLFTSKVHIAKLFCLTLVADWYENRELIGSKTSEKVRLSVQSMLTQLQYVPITIVEGEK